MKTKLTISSIAAALFVIIFLVGIIKVGYTFQLITFLVASAFAYNSVRLYGRMRPECEGKAMKAFVLGFFIFYLAFLFLLTFSVHRNDPHFILFDKELLETHIRKRANFVPFHTVNKMLLSGYRPKYVIVNILGNIAALCPLGVFLPLLFRSARRLPIFTLYATLTVLFIELTQLSFGIGSCDIDDLILNVSGAVLMFLFFKIRFVRSLVFRLLPGIEE